jgi:peptide/nickel transport system substrate-binding protein
MNRRKFVQSLAVFGAAGMMPLSAYAQTRAETLLVVMEFGPNSLDIHTVGANRPAYGVSWNCYDRLLTFGRKKLPNGTLGYDHSKLEPELAESWEVAKDGMSVTFRLRRDAKFHDGTPVTARDVKWSFDRAVSVGGFPTFQMRAGSLEKPEQFVAVDDHTFGINFLRRDKMTMPDIAVPVPSVFNSELVKKHATKEDPWGLNWTRTNAAGGGAYRVESWKPGQEIVFARNDDWKCGPMPRMRRVILREVPSAGSRRALLERGDVDISYDLPPRDFNEFAKIDKISESSVPIENAIWYLGMNVTRPPFDNVKVRQAVACVIPYERILANAFYGRATPLYGNKSPKPLSAEWPQPHPYRTDLARAKQLMQEGGAAAGFETTLSYDLGQATVSEPIAILVQEALAQIGIKTAINKIPGANWRAAMLKKDMPLMINRFGGWLNYPEYFFFWNYHGQNAVFNTMSYQNPAMDKLIDAARFETDAKRYEAHVRGFVDIVNNEVPRIPLVQPWMDVAMQRNITGYHYWFHLQPDFRQIAKG